MKVVIIFINFILITLILYNILNSKVIEGLSGCSGSNKNAIYRQQALTNRLFSELNTLKAKFGQLSGEKTTNTKLIGINKMRVRSAVSGINDEKKKKEKELADVEKGQDEQPGAAPMPTGSGGEKKFSKAIKNSAGSGRF